MLRFPWKHHPQCYSVIYTMSQLYCTVTLLMPSVTVAHWKRTKNLEPEGAAQCLLPLQNVNAHNQRRNKQTCVLMYSLEDVGL